MAIKGTYVNELGEVVDNGIVDDATNEVYDYVIVIPNTFDGESSDTLGHARTDILGNMELGSASGVDAWVRQEVDQNGLDYGDPAAVAPYKPFHDSENFTVRVMDGSGWCSEAADETVVCRGAAPPNATTVILSGTVLSYPDGEARQELTAAAVKVIIGAIKDPAIGGYNDTDGDVISDDDDNCPAIANPDQKDTDNDGVGGACEPPVMAAVPTLSEWGMILFMTIILGISVVVLSRRRMV